MEQYELVMVGEEGAFSARHMIQQNVDNVDHQFQTERVTARG